MGQGRQGRAKEGQAPPRLFRASSKHAAAGAVQTQRPAASARGLGTGKQVPECMQTWVLRLGAAFRHKPWSCLCQLQAIPHSRGAQ